MIAVEEYTTMADEIREQEIEELRRALVDKTHELVHGISQWGILRGFKGGENDEIEGMLSFIRIVTFLLRGDRPEDAKVWRKYLHAAHCLGYTKVYQISKE